MDPEDKCPVGASIRECEEELCLVIKPDELTTLHHRTGSDGQESFLLRCSHRIEWDDIRIREGAGGGFFDITELAGLKLHQRVRYYLNGMPSFLKV